MPIQKTEAIVLKRSEFRETSLLVTFYTSSFGKIRGLVKGIRCRENRHEGILDLASVNWIVFYEKSGSELYLVSQAELKEAWQGLNQQLESLLLAQVVLEEMDLLTPLQEPSHLLYNILYKTISELFNKTFSSKGQNEAQKRVWHFEAEMIRHFGVFPQLDNCLVCKEKNDNENGWISFSKGGFICNECHLKEIFAEPISAETIRILKQLAEEGETRFFPLSTQTEQELDSILRGLIEHYGERALRSARIAEMILAQ